jgi:hypothetical protein
VRRLRLLQLPDCPGAELLFRRLAETTHAATVEVDRLVVSDAGQAAGAGMTGSPTLLVDGVDPFAVAGAPTGLFCRLYRDEHGVLAGAPSVGQLRAALAAGTAGRD